MNRIYGWQNPEGEGRGRCRKCGVTHPPIVQAVPDKPVGYLRALIVDFAVVLLVMVSVLLWIAAGAPR